MSNKQQYIMELKDQLAQAKVERAKLIGELNAVNQKLERARKIAELLELNSQQTNEAQAEFAERQLRSHNKAAYNENLARNAGWFMLVFITFVFTSASQSIGMIAVVMGMFYAASNYLKDKMAYGDY